MANYTQGFKTNQTRLTLAGILSGLALLAACQAPAPNVGGPTATPTGSPATASPRPTNSPTTAPASNPSANPAAPASPSSAPVAPGSVAAGLGIKFVPLKPGSFTMGDSADGPAHQVTLSKGFEIQTTEVTQAQYQAVMGDNPSTFKGGSLPVDNVSWDEAQSFIQKLNAKGDGTYRLPTEAEWEYAARAGKAMAYACGDDEACLAGMAWYIPNSEQTTHPVGQKQPNAFGLYDMHGNVSEWVQDRYGDYPAGAVTDPTGPAKGDYRIQRGGAWNHYADRQRSADRTYSSPDGRDNVLGFRLVRTLP